MKKHHRMSHGGGGVSLALIVTPMLDMAFQILSFFIMTYHPSALEGHIPGSLVPPENVAKANKDKNKNIQNMDVNQSVPEDLLIPELETAVQVKVKCVPKGGTDKERREGQLTQILIKSGGDAGFEVIADVDSEIPQAVNMLEKRLKGLGTEKGNIKIEGEGDLKQMYVMMIYDACKKAGFNKVHFVPPPLQRVDK